jgi:autotransporter-associated beta strand protein
LKASTTFTLSANRGITVTNGGTGGILDVDSAQTLTVPALITGSGNLTKKGPGTLILSSAANNYTGKTIVETGTLSASQDANLGAAPGVAVSDQLTINGGALRWTATNSLPANRGVRLGSASSTINVDPSVTLTINGPLSGPRRIDQDRQRHVEPLGTNTYATSTSVGVGKVILNTSFVSASSIAVSAGATLELAQAPVATLKATSITASGKSTSRTTSSSSPARPWARGTARRTPA